MKATFTGRIIEIGEVRSGEGKNGPWRSARVVGEEIYGNYVNRVAFDTMNEQLETAERCQGQIVTIDVTIGAEQYKGRWYNNVRARSIAPAQAQAAAPVQSVSAPVPAAQLEPDKDDLPF